MSTLAAKVEQIVKESPFLNLVLDNAIQKVSHKSDTELEIYLVGGVLVLDCYHLSKSHIDLSQSILEGIENKSTPMGEYVSMVREAEHITEQATYIWNFVRSRISQLA